MARILRHFVVIFEVYFDSVFYQTQGCRQIRDSGRLWCVYSYKCLNYKNFSNVIMSLIKVLNHYFCQQNFYSEINKTFMDYLYQKRKEQRRFIRLKIITNRNLNFMTAVRADSTVTDLANRALNVYLQLSNQFGSKKQLTVSAVKQGRYFMPKSEYVSNLLGQDQQIEVIIVKAKPKFPNQTIPTTQHSFAQYTKHIKQFSEQRTKLPKSRLLAQLKDYHQKQKQSQQMSSSKSKLQQSKRQRKKKKKMQKQQKNKAANQHQQLNAQFNETGNVKGNKEPIGSISETNLKNSKIKQVSKQIQTVLNDVSQSSIASHINKQDQQPLKNQLSSINLQVPITAFKKKSIEQQIQKIQFQNLKKKVKIDQPYILNKAQQEKQQRSKQKLLSPNIQLSSIQSPKVTFHTEKLQSPKVIYLNDPIRKNSNDLKVSLQKDKDKLKSPALLPKCSPKITFTQSSYSKQLLTKINEASGLSSKQKQQKPTVDFSQIQINILSPKQKVNQQKKSLKRDSPVTDKQKKQETSKKTQPQIIEQQSSQNQQYVDLKSKNYSSSYKYSKKSKNSSKSNNPSRKAQDSSNSRNSSDRSEPQQNLNRNPSTKSSTKDKFYQIEMKMKKFKLQDSSDQE